MNVQQQIAKLESLLGRIRRNAEGPRPAGILVETVAPLPHPDRAPPSVAAAPVTAPSQELEVVPDVEEMDMMDAEIVELGGAEADAGLEADLSSQPEEHVPESAPRPATAYAAESVGSEADLEPPVKTPPPESGRQVMVSIPTAVAFRTDEADIDASDVDALLEPDLSGGPISKAPPGQPSMEQLGETVDLVGADRPASELELVEVPDEVESAVAADDLELALPQQGFAGGYHDALQPPRDAQADLERHRVAQGVVEPARGIPAVAPAPVAVAAAPKVEEPVVFARPATDVVHVAQVVAAKPRAVPTTFVALLDESLSLRAD